MNQLAIMRMRKGLAAMRQDKTLVDLPQMNVSQIYADLKRLGADDYDMYLPETHRLPYLMNPGERLEGIVYGRYQRKGGYGQSARAPMHGRGALFITDRRVIFLDKKPLFLHCDEIPLDLISGVTFSKVGYAGTVTLRTKSGDYAIRTFNHHCADNFVAAIEAARFAARNNEV